MEQAIIKNVWFVRMANTVTVLRLPHKVALMISFIQSRHNNLRLVQNPYTNVTKNLMGKTVTDMVQTVKGLTEQIYHIMMQITLQNAVSIIAKVARLCPVMVILGQMIMVALTIPQRPTTT